MKLCISEAILNCFKYHSMKLDVTHPCYNNILFPYCDRERLYYLPTFCWFDNFIFYPLGLEKESLRAQKM